MQVSLGQVVDFTFTTLGRGSVRHTHYATGEVVKVGKRISVRVRPDGLSTGKHDFWNTGHIGAVKVINPDSIIPPMAE